MPSFGILQSIFVDKEDKYFLLMLPLPGSAHCNGINIIIISKE